MAWLVVILLTIVALANLLDFLLGPRGQRRLKDRLVDWYVVIEEAPWTGIVQFAAKNLDKFLSRLFGPDLISGLSFRRVVYFSGCLNLLLLAIYLTYDQKFTVWIWTSGGKILAWNIFNIFVVVTVNMLMDFISGWFFREGLSLIWKQVLFRK